MSEVNGRVNEVYSYNTKFGDMYGVVVDGQKYGAGKVKPRASEGDTVSFRYTKNGSYNNIDMKTFSVVEAGKPSSGGGSPRSGGGVSGESFGDRQNSIVRQNAVSSAVAWLGTLASIDAIPGITKTMKADDRYGIMTALLAETADEFFNANIKGTSLSGGKAGGSSSVRGEASDSDDSWE